MLITQRVQPKARDLTNVLIVIFVFLALSLVVTERTRFESLDTLTSNAQSVLPSAIFATSSDRENLTVSVVQKSGASVVTVAEMLPVSDLRQMLNSSLPNQPSNPTQGLPQNIGSGFIITSDGYIATSKHVVSDSKYSYKVLTANGLEFDVTNIYPDPNNDVAILKINPNQHKNQTLKPLPLGDSSQVKVGEDVLAIGTALGQFTNTVTHGVISGVGRQIVAGNDNFEQSENLQDMLQTSAAINPGNSGGPLLNLEGQVIGVNTATSISGQDIGFALPINAVKDFSKNLVQSI